MKLYIVGGYVRDEILGIKSNDIDFAVEAESFDIMKQIILSYNYYDIFLEKEELGTIRAKDRRDNGVYDYTLCRKDGIYSDFRRPDNIEITDIYGDLSRRDFTMNAIAIDIDNNNKIIDPFNGIHDIKTKTIRCVGLAENRLIEDPLRFMRALRFSVTLNFSIDDSILDVASNKKFYYSFSKLCKERIYVELKKMFEHDTIKSMKLLSSLPDSMLDLIFIDGLYMIPTMKKIK
uniref:Poly A polymerase head domain protein n=1 Tax=Pithovirus LCPAC101 TaxID=2506586 RepID=A0A481Z211_9VIRU|nr:MAG: poly A polymerase head domain protein [Pithovirus LCPAC101]